MKSKQKKFYDSRYSAVKRALHKIQNKLVLCYDAKLIEIMREMAELKSVDSALEVGCGQGTDAILISKHCHHVVAVDISSSALRVASLLSRMNSSSEKLSLVAGDAEHLPLRVNLFDIVFCKDLLHHVSNSVSAVLEMRRAAKIGAKVTAIESNACSPEMISIGLIYFGVDRGVFRNTKTNLMASFERAKLSHVKAMETEFLPRHILFEYRSPLCRLPACNSKLILRTLRKIEEKLQKLSFVRRFANYIIVQGVNKVA